MVQLFYHLAQTNKVALINVNKSGLRGNKVDRNIGKEFLRYLNSIGKTGVLFY